MFREPVIDRMSRRDRWWMLLAVLLSMVAAGAVGFGLGRSTAKVSCYEDETGMVLRGRLVCVPTDNLTTD